MERLLDINEAAELLNLSRYTIYKMRFEGRLPYVKICRRLLFRLEDLETWVRENTHGK